MNRLQYITDMITAIVGDKIKAEMVMERLRDEGLLVLGYGNVDIDQVVEKFSSTFGTTRTTKYDRFAAGRLTAKYGAQSVCGIIGLLGVAGDERYKPVVNNITELENKWVSVVAFLRKNNGKDNIIET